LVELWINNVQDFQTEDLYDAVYKQEYKRLKRREAELRKEAKACKTEKDRQNNSNLRRAVEAQLTKIIAYPLPEAIKKRLNEFTRLHNYECSWEEFLEAREEIIDFNKDHRHLRRVEKLDQWKRNGEKDSHKYGFKGVCKRDIKFYDLFGPPHLFLHAGPDYSIILVAKMKQDDGGFGEMCGKSLHNDVQKALKADKNILSRNQFGLVVRVFHEKQRMVVKTYEKSKMLMEPANNNILDHAPTEVWNVRLLNRIDVNSPRAEYPCPYVQAFYKVGKSEDGDTYYFASENGYDLIAMDKDGNFKEGTYMRRLEKYLSNTKHERKKDRKYGLKIENISQHETISRKQVLQIALALCFLHWRGYAHNDIKLENIICGTYDKNCRIIDFAQAVRFHPLEPHYGKMSHDGVGTQKYRSPEAEYVRLFWGVHQVCLSDKKEFDAFKNDVWCLTNLMFRLIFNIAPYQDASNTDPNFRDVTRGAYMTQEQREMSPNEGHGILKMLRRYPNNRDAQGNKCHRHLMATQPCLDLMHRGFAREEQRPTIFEFVMDPYFNSVRGEVIKEIQDYQQLHFEQYDDILKNLHDETSYKRDPARVPQPQTPPPQTLKRDLSGVVTPDKKVKKAYKERNSK